MFVKGTEKYTQRAPGAARYLYTDCIKKINRNAQRRTEQRGPKNRVFK